VTQSCVVGKKNIEPWGQPSGQEGDERLVPQSAGTKISEEKAAHAFSSVKRIHLSK